MKLRHLRNRMDCYLKKVVQKWMSILMMYLKDFLKKFMMPKIDSIQRCLRAQVISNKERRKIQELICKKHRQIKIIQMEIIMIIIIIILHCVHPVIE